MASRSHFINPNRAFGKKYMPHFSGPATPCVMGEIRLELLCVVSPLYFAEALERHAADLYKMAINVGLVWGQSQNALRARNPNIMFHDLWNEPHTIEGFKIEIDDV